MEKFKKNKKLYKWIPVSPLLLYWMIAYFLFNFGVFKTPEIEIETHIYFIAYLALFSIAYYIGLRKPRKYLESNFLDSYHDAKTIKILRYSSFLFFIGALLYLYDRLSSGAGSLELVQEELYNIRGEYSKNTSLITTLGVIPFSAKIICFGVLFYRRYKNFSIPLSAQFFIAFGIFSELYNMVLGANRGALLFYIYYLAFFIFFVTGFELKEIFTKKKSVLYLSIVFLAVYMANQYFLWVAENRVVLHVAERVGMEAFYALKDQSMFRNYDYAALGAIHQIHYYLTHGFEYTNAIIKHAPIINFDIFSALGTRVEGQIQRFSPEFIFPARSDLLRWIDIEGLMLSGWPSIFGYSMALFGIFGSLILSPLFGYIFGSLVKNWSCDGDFGSFLLVFLIYVSLILSFDWIVRGFDQYAALLFGVYLQLKFSKRRNMISHDQYR